MLAALSRMLVCCLVFAGAPGSKPKAEDTGKDTAPEAVKGILPRELGGHMKFLASDLMKGRDTASPETLLAAEYLADHVEAFGAEPMGEIVDGKPTFFQHFPLESVTIEDEGTEIKVITQKDGADATQEFAFNTDFFVVRPGSSTDAVEGPAVFVGSPMGDKDGKLVDFSIDVKDRIVVATFSQAAFRRPAAESTENRPLNPFQLEQAMSEKGALALVLARPGTPAAAKKKANRGGASTGPMRLREERADRKEIAAVIASPGLSNAIFEAGGIAPDKLDPKPLEGVKIKVRINGKRNLKEDRNVVAIFPGGDPEKKKEIVIYSAHYDHVGVGAGGVIHNGSDDNSSGTSALLEIAQAFGQSPRPARSVAFLWVSGEEKGLLGSEWFTGHMTLPEGYKIVADINIDMVSRNDSKQISVHPSSKHDGYNTLIPDAVLACKDEELEVKWDADEFYARTDSFNFAKRGVPIIFFFSGLHPDYHQPTDDVAKADFEKAARVARSAFRLGWKTAQAAELPKKLGAVKETKEAGAAQ